MKTFEFTKKKFIMTVAVLSAYIENLKDDVEYILTVKEKKRSRSLNANACMWALCEKLAKRIGLTKDEVYQEHIRNVGVYKDVPLPENAVDTMMQAWKMIGTGWVSDRVDYESDDDVIVRFYYGSSVYSRKQMSRLIENVVQDCKEQGIETMTPDELELLKVQWKGIET